VALVLRELDKWSNAPSASSPAVDEERTTPVHWLWTMLCVPLSVFRETHSTSWKRTSGSWLSVLFQNKEEEDLKGRNRTG